MTTLKYTWDSTWTTIDTGIVLTQGGTIQDISDAIDMDEHMRAMLSIEATYSDHAKATAGLSVTILREANDTPSYETEKGAATAIEMPFTQNNTERKTISLGCDEFEKIKVQLDWGNTTSGSSVTVNTKIKYATVVSA